MTNFRVLLFYKYIPIPDAERFAAEHLAYCKELGIKGRILIADEGINGTLSGTIEQTEQYMRDLRSNPLFQDIVFKIDASDAHAFKKMFVRYRKELVTLRYDKPLDPNRDGGGRLRPSEFYAWPSVRMWSFWTAAPDMSLIWGIFKARYARKSTLSANFRLGWPSISASTRTGRSLLIVPAGPLRDVNGSHARPRIQGSVPAGRRHRHLRTGSGDARQRL